ncbi:MAG: hypothetical protein DCF22_03120 [Leptolyngbya sp.]|nr:MAG: hypothetical protein DCF22_03120 [Leptolyngbya sp.]
MRRAESSYGAYVPDLPGCVAVAETLAEVKALIQEVIAFHLEGLRSDAVRFLHRLRSVSMLKPSLYEDYRYSLITTKLLREPSQINISTQE